jgi:hypothetical protein
MSDDALDETVRERWPACLCWRPLRLFRIPGALRDIAVHLQLLAVCDRPRQRHRRWQGGMVEVVKALSAF